MQEVDVYYINDKYPVFVTYLGASSEFTDHLEKNIEDYRKEHPIPNESYVKSWHSDYKTWQNTRIFDEINLVLIRKCESIVGSYKKERTKLKMHDMWVNIYEKGDYAKLHSHAPTDISCCYYINAKENCSPIKFPPKLEITPKNDMLIIFSGNLYHEVLPTDGERTLISLNMDYSKRPSKSSISLSYS